MHRAFLTALLVAGCTAVPAADEGNETGPCLDNGCFGGLTCLSNLCVDPDWEPPGGSDDDDDEDSEEEDEADDSDGDAAGDSAASDDEGSDTDGLTTGAESSGTDPTDPSGSSTDPTFDPTDPTGADGSESSGDPTDDGTSDYGSCDACAADEMPVGLEGVTGCFCSPMCDGTSCPAPNDGTAEAVCALTLEAGGDPTQCALICNSTDDCPTGATCEDAGGASLCMHPA